MSRLEQAPVSHAHPSLTYRGLLALPGAGRAFGAAGVAGGAFSAGTLTAPVKARLLDRRGQRVMLPLLGLGAAAAMLAMALLDQAGYRNPLPYIVACAAAGALTPPVGAAMRARWAVITGGGRNLERAYSLDAATEETLFMAGPLLTGVAVTVAGAADAGHGGAAGSRVRAAGGLGCRRPGAGTAPGRSGGPAGRARLPG